MELTKKAYSRTYYIDFLTIYSTVFDKTRNYCIVY